MKNTKIKIKLFEKPASKLEFVKLVLRCSDLGLKGSKDLCDQLWERPGIPQIFDTRKDPNIDFAKTFRQDLKLLGGKFHVNGGIEFERQFKLLELGIGNHSDYTEYIIDFLENNFDQQKELLTFVLSKLSKEELISVFEKSKTKEEI